MRILLIEDDPDIAEFMLRALREEGYSADHTDSGKKGIFLSKVNDYDLLIVDIMLPDIEGFDVCKEIRRSGKTVPILMTTVKSEVGDKVRAFDLGADDYLCKPFALEELNVRIKALLRRPSNLVEEIYRIGHMFVDIKKRIVISRGKEVVLRPREFSLLEYLLRNKGIVQSRSMLLEHVWDMNVDPFTNTVDVHVRSLRRKIADEDCKIIKTIHGKGYKIGD